MKGGMLPRFWATGALIGLLAGETLLLALQHVDQQEAMLVGWGVAVLLHGLGLFWFNRGKTDRGNRNPFFVLIVIITRLFALIISVLTVLLVTFLNPEAYVVGLLSGYFAGSWREIVWLRGATPPAGP